MVRTLLVCVLLLSGTVSAANYDVVKRAAGGVTLDGTVDEAVWAGIPALDAGFQYPWEKVETPSTVFKAFHDGVNFYFSFVCADSQVLVKKDFAAGERATVDVEDRVELFFAPGPINAPLAGKLPAYYNVEVDPAGRVHDYSMVFYRAAMDSDWDMPGVKSSGKTTATGYAVEACIPLDSFRQLGLLTGDGDTLRVGAFRAEFSGSVDDPDNINMRWISWVDPATAEPDFHVESAFGTFTLLQ